MSSGSGFTVGTGEWQSVNYGSLTANMNVPNGSVFRRLLVRIGQVIDFKQVFRSGIGGMELVKHRPCISASCT
ncbi:MAG TPA: hypothetical protein PKE22_10990, partial [Ottowia sp.]|nr:hypothetical protein [Ottowia sp.]